MTATRKRQAWNYTPELPLRSAPFLHWPLRPGAIARHLVRTWRPLTARCFMLGAAFAIWRWASPSLAEAESFRLGWVLEIWVRNVVVLAVVAGGLHLFLQRYRVQGDGLRYDARPMIRNKSVFLLGDQVKDNMLLNLPATLVATGGEALVWWAYANGIAPYRTFEDNPVWFIALLGIVPLLSILYFSAGHWLLHRRPVYKHVHSWHHRNTNVGPWSGLAMHPLEHVVLYGDFALFLILPSSPVHLLFAMLHHTIGAPMSHTGYDGLRLPWRQRLDFGDFHHQLHHRFIECNYGGLESPLDEMIGSFHDGTAEGDRMVTDRLRRLAGQQRTAP